MLHSDRERYVCRRLTLCDVTKAFSVNASRLGKDFTEHLGESFDQYANRLKAIKTCPMLSMTDQPIGEISEKQRLRNNGHGAAREKTTIEHRSHSSIRCVGFVWNQR